MPYVVTTASLERCPDCDSNPWSQRLGSGEPGCAACSNLGTYLVPDSRRVVATLDEARAQCSLIVQPRADLMPLDSRAMRAIQDLPESGGTVGPLPDGTVIEVERETWHVLACAPGHNNHPDVLPVEPSEQAKAEIIAAYNEQGESQ